MFFQAVLVAEGHPRYNLAHASLHWVLLFWIALQQRNGHCVVLSIPVLC